MAGSLLSSSIFGYFADNGHCYCAQHGTNARFGANVRFRQQAIRRLPQPPAAGFAYPAAAPLGATHFAPSVGAYKTGIILKCAAQMAGAQE
jgi:hypothetical protein